ncbi:Protein kinase kin1 [Choanephora cucurbitarum]|uniref:Protein kinase kin1 n=1 Tax=Choanephora cucurbitarum TaxID=101091 RepID=A0A1C7NPQ4_9FUNG|nr:Protein kinase kin1 [Choanephora cucurbitarum]
MQATTDQKAKRQPSTKQSRESLSRKTSERHQVMKIQNYVIYRKTIGAGSMGKVKLAECLTDPDKQKYAVKIMPKVDFEALAGKTKSKDPKDTPEEREQRTIREMAIMRLLRHPNICQLKEYITEGDKYYMFLEYVDGGQLLDYIIKHGKLREKQARRFARQIVSALDYCHRNSIVHRDLKIENILITQSEQLKIIDFGLSNVYSPTQQLDTFCGSLYFAAPELLRAKHYTGPEVDIWSFGVVLYVLVCGRVPFDDTNLPALHEKIKAGVVEDYPDHLGKDCLDLLSKIFVVDPAQRITLSAIQAHPWMNKGYEEPIRNYLPRRQPIEHIDMDIVKGMHGFGLGSPEEIREKLEKIIHSPDYQSAASKIDQNFQKKVNDDQSLANKSRWRRSLSTRKKTVIQDDFQTLPAMYDPLVSVYYLVKERKESDERKQQLLNAEPNALTLSRSTSTLVGSQSSRPDSTQEPAVPLARSKSTGTRRRTSKKLPDLPSLKKETATQTAPNTPVPSKSERVSTSTLIRKKSIQAVKKFGLKIPGIGNPSVQAPDDGASDTSVVPASRTSSKRSNASVPASADPRERSTESIPTSASSRKSTWLKQSSNDATLRDQQKRQTQELSRRPSWRKLSFSQKSTPPSLDQSTLDDAQEAKTAVSVSPSQSSKSKHEEGIVDQKNLPPVTLKKSTSERVPSSKNRAKSPSPPKSFFNFNRGHLFRVTSMQIMIDLQQVLDQLHIPFSNSTADQFTFHCVCPHSVWKHYVTLSPEETQNIPDYGDLKFSVMVYEARWAGHKMGIKVKEHDEHNTHNFYTKQILRNINHALLGQFEKMYN